MKVDGAVLRLLSQLGPERLGRLGGCFRADCLWAALGGNCRVSYLVETRLYYLYIRGVRGYTLKCWKEIKT